MAWGNAVGVASWVDKLAKDDPSLTSVTVFRGRAFGPDADVDALVAAADPEGLGRVSYKDWLALKAKLAEAHDRDELAGRGERASEETRGREKENAVADAERRRR